jgi:serine/threonine protein kinase
MLTDLVYIDQGLCYGNKDGATFYIKTIPHLQDKYLIQHQCIVPVVDIIHNEDNKSILYPYTEGRLIDVIHSNQSISEQHVQSIVYQLLHALYGFHSNGVEHGSIEPRNIFIDSSCSITLGTIYERKPYSTPEMLEQATVHIVSPIYQSPFLQGLAQDLFSVGCIMSELVQMIDSENEPRYLITSVYSKEEVERAVQHITLPETTPVAQELIQLLLAGETPIEELVRHSFFKSFSKQTLVAGSMFVQ